MSTKKVCPKGNDPDFPSGYNPASMGPTSGRRYETTDAGYKAGMSKERVLRVVPECYDERLRDEWLKGFDDACDVQNFTVQVPLKFDNTVQRAILPAVGDYSFTIHMDDYNLEGTFEEVFSKMSRHVLWHLKKELFSVPVVQDDTITTIKEEDDG